MGYAMGTPMEVMNRPCRLLPDFDCWLFFLPFFRAFKILWLINWLDQWATYWVMRWGFCLPIAQSLPSALGQKKSGYGIRRYDNKEWMIAATYPIPRFPFGLLPKIASSRATLPNELSHSWSGHCERLYGRMSTGFGTPYLVAELHAARKIFQKNSQNLLCKHTIFS